MRCKRFMNAHHPRDVRCTWLQYGRCLMATSANYSVRMAVWYGLGYPWKLSTVIPRKRHELEIGKCFLVSFPWCLRGSYDMPRILLRKAFFSLSSPDLKTYFPILVHTFSDFSMLLLSHSSAMFSCPGSTPTPTSLVVCFPFDLRNSNVSMVIPTTTGVGA